MLRSSFFLVLLAASLSGCPRPEVQPEDALRRFLADLQYGRADAAWAALSDGSKEELLKRHRALAQAGQRPASDRPADILYGELGIEVLASPENIVVVSPLGPEVVLRVAVKGGRSAELRMQRAGVDWRVDLVSALHPAPSLDEGLRGPSDPPKPE